jgi:hypothetical protein
MTFQILDISFKVLTFNKIIRRWGNLFTCDATNVFWVKVLHHGRRKFDVKCAKEIVGKNSAKIDIF